MCNEVPFISIHSIQENVSRLNWRFKAWTMNKRFLLKNVKSRLKAFITRNMQFASIEALFKYKNTKNKFLKFYISMICEISSYLSSPNQIFLSAIQSVIINFLTPFNYTFLWDLDDEGQINKKSHNFNKYNCIKNIHYYKI